MQSETVEQPQQNAEPKVERSERGRSTIEWPYFSLDESFKLARATYEMGGSCQLDQLAGQLGQSASGGTFRLKVQAARIFGLLVVTNGNVSLGDLGSRMMEPETERAARAEAFLRVPLYKALYDNFQGKTLPGNQGLEGAMVNLGVVSDQKDKARQTFQRSARDAGFFTFGPTKLVYPVLNQERNSKPQTLSAPPEVSTPAPAEPNPGWTATPFGGGGGSGSGLNPFIQGLLQKLPPEDSDWPLEGRRKWLQSAISIFDLIYQREVNDEDLSVRLGKNSAN